MRRIDLNLEALSRLSWVIPETSGFLKLFRLQSSSGWSIVQHWFRILGSFKNRKSLNPKIMHPRAAHNPTDSGW